MRTFKSFLIMLLSTFSISTFAYDFEVDGIQYTITSLTELTVQVDGVADKTVSSVIIPEAVEYKSKSLAVLTIGNTALKDMENLKEVIIPNSMYAAVIPLFIKQYLNHKQPQINGDGTNTRDFTYIDNVIHMNMLALKTTNPQAINQIYNTAGGERTSINQLANDIRTNLSQYNSSIADIQPIHGPNRLGDIPHSFACIDKARTLLNYSPLVSFQEGLSATVKWYVCH